MLEQKVSEELKNLIMPQEKIVVGVSGGPDSMCLLHILNKLKYNIIVAHINHMIRNDASEDEAYVKDYCDKYNIPIYIKRIDVTQKSNNEKIRIRRGR